ncbi:MAG TPA: CHAT domain-containing protein [Kofleriaceae bacterium]
MSDEVHIILLLDLAAEDPVDEAMVRGCLPPEATPRVLRLTEFGAVRCSMGMPDNWLLVLSAIERMLRAARAAERDDHGRYWVAGRAGLPAFLYLGYRLSKRAIVTLVDRRDAGPIDVLALDAAGPPSQPYFERSPWPRRPSYTETPLAWIVSSQNRIALEQVGGAMARRGAPSAPAVEAQAEGALDAASLGAALRELDDQAAGLRTWYPRSTALTVFVAGPAALAFLAGRALNPHAFPDVEVWQAGDPSYELAYETRSRRRKHIILFMPANPVRTTRIALGEEAYDLQQELARCQYRDRFELQPQLAPRATDIHRHLEALRPSVVHFSGHGEPDGLVFHQDDGSFRAVSPDELREIFRSSSVSAKLAVLSGCFSEPHAEALLEHVDCVVGMPGPIRDDAARSFAVGFYEALGDRASVQTAYELGCFAMRLWPREAAPGEGHDVGSDERTRPRLLVRPGVDASTLVLAGLD